MPINSTEEARLEARPRCRCSVKKVLKFPLTEFISQKMRNIRMSGGGSRGFAVVSSAGANVFRFLRVCQILILPSCPPP